MSKPLFVETSVGFINVALVTQILYREDKIQFVFSGSTSSGEEAVSPDLIELPEREGRIIIDQMKTVLPDSFIG